MEVGSVKKRREKRRETKEIAEDIESFWVLPFTAACPILFGYIYICIYIYIYMYFLCFSLIENIGRCETWCECFIVDHMMCQFWLSWNRFLWIFYPTYSWWWLCSCWNIVWPSCLLPAQSFPTRASGFKMHVCLISWIIFVYFVFTISSQAFACSFRHACS